MRRRDEGALSVEVWLGYAGADLEVVRDYVGRAEHAHTTCFHAQQAAEKALKGLLSWLGVEDIPRSHDLELLADLITRYGGPELPEHEEFELLTRHAVRSRYPGQEMPSLVDAADALRVAEAIVAFVRGCISDEGTDCPG